MTVYTHPTTLHLYYDLEKPGYRDYHRRHYPERYRLTLSEPVYKPRGRAHVPSPPLEEVQWRPHGAHIEPIYSNFGPDWESRRRYIPSPHNPNAKLALPVAYIENNRHYIRSFPQNWQRTNNEWLYFSDEPIDTRSSKRNFFPNIYLRSLEDLGDDDVHMLQIGRKKKVFDMRNSFPECSEGDKNYRTVEYSPDFFKIGCTLPAVNFGRLKQRHVPSKCYVPMKNEKIPVIDENEFEKKELENEHDQLVNEVIQLENWQPAKSVTSAFKVLNIEPTDDTPAPRYRPRFR